MVFFLWWRLGILLKRETCWVDWSKANLDEVFILFVQGCLVEHGVVIRHGLAAEVPGALI